MKKKECEGVLRAFTCAPAGAGDMWELIHRAGRGLILLDDTYCYIDFIKEYNSEVWFNGNS